MCHQYLGESGSAIQVTSGGCWPQWKISPLSSHCPSSQLHSYLPNCTMPGAKAALSLIDIHWLRWRSWWPGKNVCLASNFFHDLCCVCSSCASKNVDDVCCDKGGFQMGEMGGLLKYTSSNLNLDHKIDLVGFSLWCAFFLATHTLFLSQLPTCYLSLSRIKLNLHVYSVPHQCKIYNFVAYNCFPDILLWLTTLSLPLNFANHF